MTISLKSIKNRYDNLSIVAKASLWATFCGFAQKGIALLTTPIFTRLMTTEQYGIVTIYLSWLNIITIVCSLYVTYGGFTYGMIKYPQKKEQYTSSVLVLTTIMTLFWLFVYIIFRNPLNKFTTLSTLLTLLIFAEIITQSALSIWTTRQRYDFKYRKATIVTLITVIATPILGVIGVIIANDNYKSLARILSFVIVNSVVGILLYIVIIHKGHSYFNKEFWKFTLQFNIPLIPHYLSQTVLNQVDRIMINNMCNTSQAAIYGLAYNVGMLLNILSAAINSAFIPWMYRQVKDKKEDSIGEKANYILLILATLVLFVMLLAPELVKVLGSKEYFEAIYVVPPVASSVFFIFLFSLFVNIELYHEKNILVMIGSFVAAVTNLVLNYIFIKMFGYIAAGYTTLASYVFISFVHYIFMVSIRKKMNLSKNIYNLKVILLLSSAMILISCLVPFLYGTIIIRYVIIVLIIFTLFIKRNSIIKLVSQLKNTK